MINLPKYKGISVVRQRHHEDFFGTEAFTPASLLITEAMLRRQIANEVEFIDANALDLSYKYCHSTQKQKIRRGNIHLLSSHNRTRNGNL
jgi:hypothetical protein